LYKKQSQKLFFNRKKQFLSSSDVPLPSFGYLITITLFSNTTAHKDTSLSRW